MTNLLQQRVVNYRSQRKKLECLLNYHQIAMEVKIHPKYAAEIDFCFYLWAHNSKMSTPIVPTNIMSPKGTQFMSS